MGSGDYMRLLILVIILSITVHGKEPLHIHYAQKRPNSTEVHIPLDGFTGEKKDGIHKFYTEVSTKLNSGQDLPVEGYKKQATTTYNSHWNNDRYDLIGDNAEYFENVTGFSIHSPWVTFLVSSGGEIKLDTIQFESFELYFSMGAAGQGWEVTAKFKIKRSSQLFALGSGRNIPLFACPPNQIAQPLKPAQFTEVEIPEAVSIFHDENTNFRTKYWKDNEAFITKHSSYADWILTQNFRVVQKLFPIRVYSDTGYEPWYLSLCALPTYETYSQATVLDQTGEVLVKEIATMYGVISNCYGTILLNQNNRGSEAIVCRVNARHGNSHIIILEPSENGRFDELFSYWDIRD